MVESQQKRLFQNAFVEDDDNESIHQEQDTDEQQSEEEMQVSLE